MVERPLERRFPRLHPRVLKIIWRSLVVIVLAFIGALLPFFTSFTSLVYVSSHCILSCIQKRCTTTGARWDLYVRCSEWSFCFNTTIIVGHMILNLAPPLLITTVANHRLLPTGDVDQAVQPWQVDQGGALLCERVCVRRHTAGHCRLSGEHCGERIQLYLWLAMIMYYNYDIKGYYIYV